MRLIAAVAVIAALVLGGYAVWEVQTMTEAMQRLQLNVNQLQHELERLENALTSLESSADQASVIVYWLEETPSDFRLIPAAQQTSEPATPRKALELLVKGPGADSSLSRIVPDGTQILGFSIDNEQATANFSREISDNFNWGAQLEALLVESIVRTLTAFPEIVQVQILVEGEIIETLGGHVSIDEPLRR